EFVTDDHKPKIAKKWMVFKLGANHGERFYQTRDILLGTDGSGIEDEGRLNGIALQDLLILTGIGRIDGEGRIGSAVDCADALGGNLQEAFDIAARGMGDGDDPRGTHRATAIPLTMHGAANV